MNYEIPCNINLFPRRSVKVNKKSNTVCKQVSNIDYGFTTEL